MSGARGYAYEAQKPRYMKSTVNNLERSSFNHLQARLFGQGRERESGMKREKGGEYYIKPFL